ncbi:MAG: hypothetical protein K8R41_11665, partial [Bacteroidales bacterium]|nr:hypothetical protein [Bacteroidales bacterium]
MKNQLIKSKLYILLCLFVLIILSGCSNLVEQESTNVDKTVSAGTNVLDGNFWKNQALTDILPYW